MTEETAGCVLKTPWDVFRRLGLITGLGQEKGITRRLRSAGWIAERIA